MLLLVALAVMSILAGAALHVSLPAFLAAATGILGWLLIFGVREHFARAKQR